jgi:hypothetical protein
MFFNGKYLTKYKENLSDYTACLCINGSVNAIDEHQNQLCMQNRKWRILKTCGAHQARSHPFSWTKYSRCMQTGGLLSPLLFCEHALSSLWEEHKMMFVDKAVRKIYGRRMIRNRENYISVQPFIYLSTLIYSSVHPSFSAMHFSFLIR